MGLLLEAADADGERRWRWTLRDSNTGQIVAGHTVALDPESDELTAFENLYAYVRWHVSPDRRNEDEARILRRLGSWAADGVLGAEVCAAIVTAAPVTVRVTVPESLHRVLMWPLELARVGGEPLVDRGDVGFVYDVGAGGGGVAAPRERGVSEALRLLAVFSLPSGMALTAARRERYELSRLVARLSEQGRAVELRVLQYGVTRKLLAETVGSGSGWDVLHLSSHGSPGLFALQKPDGSPDWIATSDLIDLLRPARGVKLAVVSSCSSAAEDVTTAPARLIGPDAPARQDRAAHVVGLAHGLVRDLGCTVVATRYPVTAERMTVFNAVFYARLLGAGDSVDVAAARALAERPVDRLVYQVSPAMFGAGSIGLMLTAPPRGEAPVHADQWAAGFPDEPYQFIGRSAIMSVATGALAVGSEKTVVALHGMPGIGATTCALELAYRQREDFTAVAYWKAPGRGTGGSVGALADFAASLHDQIGLPLPSHVPPGRWERYAKRLSGGLRDARLLIVVDDVDALLSPDGAWRDPRWPRILTAFTAHGGPSRLILVGRVLPSLDDMASRTIPLEPLNGDESWVLVRELPDLRAVLWPAAGAAGNPGEADSARGRDLVDAAAGHPGLLTRVNEWVMHPDALDARLAEAKDEIAGWTRTTLASQRPNVRLMAEFLARLTTEDRRQEVVEAAWPRLWVRLGRPGEPPKLGPLLDALAAAALIRRPGAVIVMHPVVAAATQQAAAQDIRESADKILASFWQAPPDSLASMLGSSARSALSYMLRQRAYGAAADLLSTLTPVQLGTIGAAAVPMLRQVAAETGSPAARVALAMALRESGDRTVSEARELLESALSSARDVGDFRLSWDAAGFLVTLEVIAGRLPAALALTSRREEFAKLAGLGPWTQLAGVAQRLDVQQRMGQYEQVLAEIRTLRSRLDRMGDDGPSDSAGAVERVTAWSVRESILEAGREAAEGLGRWQDALDTSTEALDSGRRLGLSGYALADWQQERAECLVRLGRLAEAAVLLAETQQAVEDRGDRKLLAHVLSSRASLEDARGRPDAAVDLERTSLRLRYEGNAGPGPIASCHLRLAWSLRRASGYGEEEAAHFIAGSLISALTGMNTGPVSPERAVAAAMQDVDRSRFLPRTVAKVIQVTEWTDGVRLGELLASMQPDKQELAAFLARLERNQTE